MCLFPPIYILLSFHELVFFLHLALDVLQLVFVIFTQARETFYFSLKSLYWGQTDIAHLLKVNNPKKRRREILFFFFFLLTIACLVWVISVTAKCVLVKSQEQKCQLKFVFPVQQFDTKLFFKGLSKIHTSSILLFISLAGGLTFFFFFFKSLWSYGLRKRQALYQHAHSLGCR